MGRGVGKCQWQTIEVLAAFLAGEAACDARAATTTKARGAAASVQYASWLRKLDKDAERTADLPRTIPNH